MASQYFKQFLYSANPMLTFIEGSVTIGGSGAVSTVPGVIPASSGVIGTGVTSVTKTGTGQYQIQLNDNYSRLVGVDFMAISPSTGASSVSDGSLSVGTPYKIVFPSTSTNWTTLGLPTGLTPTIGMTFVATSGNSGGNGVVVKQIPSGIATFEVLSGANLELGPLPTKGGYVQFQTLNTSGAAAAPSSGTVIRFNLMLRNSSLLGTNETASNI